MSVFVISPHCSLTPKNKITTGQRTAIVNANETDSDGLLSGTRNVCAISGLNMHMLVYVHMTHDRNNSLFIINTFVSLNF